MFNLPTWPMCVCLTPALSLAQVSHGQTRLHNLYLQCNATTKHSYVNRTVNAIMNNNLSNNNSHNLQDKIRQHTMVIQ